MICDVLTFASGILDLGSAPNSFGQTLALLITFLGIGVIANVLIVYAVAQVLAERKQNEERAEAFHQSHNRT
jgi:F0F1-type ATP synthase assembly protein I